jgi:hypothetical protein
MLRKMMLAVFALLLMAPAYAGDPSDMLINVMTRKEGTKVVIYNPMTVYGQTIYYWVDTHAHHDHLFMNVGSGDGGYEVDLADIFQRAANIWNAYLARAGAPIRIQRTMYPTANYIYVGVNSPFQESDARNVIWTDTTLAFTVPPQALIANYDGTDTGVFFNPLPGDSPNAFRLTDAAMQTARNTFQPGPDQDRKIVELIALYGAVHELGHVMGLLHWGFSPLQMNQLWQSRFLAVRAQGNPPDVAPIMMPNMWDYLARRLAELGHRLPLDDSAIVIANTEVNELTRIMQCPQDQQVARAMSTADDTCRLGELSGPVYPMAERLLPFLFVY